MREMYFPPFKFNPELNVWEEDDSTTLQEICGSNLKFNVGNTIINGITEVSEEFPNEGESPFLSKLINKNQWFILRRIFMYLDERSFQNCKLVCKPFKHAIDLMFTNSMAGQSISSVRLEQQWKRAFPVQYFINCKYRIKSVYVEGPEIFCCLENGRINIYEKRTRNLKKILRHSQFWPRLLAINETYVISGYGCDQLRFWQRGTYKCLGVVNLHFRVRDLRLTKSDKLVVTFFSGRVKIYEIIGSTNTIRVNKLYHYAPEHNQESLIQVDTDKSILYTAMRRYWIHTFSLETGTVLKSKHIPNKTLLSIHMCYPYAVNVCYALQGDIIELWNIATMVQLGKFITSNRILAVGINYKRIVLFTPRGSFLLNYAEELAKRSETNPTKVLFGNFTQMYGPVCSGGLHYRDIYMDDKVAIYHDKFQCYVRIVDYSSGHLRNQSATNRDLLSHHYIQTMNEYSNVHEAFMTIVERIKEKVFGIPRTLPLT